MAHHGIELPDDKLGEFCRRHRIRKLALFGSVLREDFAEDNDIDLLAEFELSVSVGLRLFSTERELSEVLGRRVHLNTPGFLGKYVRDDVLKEAKVLYDAVG